MTASFDWFGSWVQQNLAVTFTVAKAPSASDFIAALGADPTDSRTETFEQAEDRMSGLPYVRVGKLDSWRFAVEHFTAVGNGIDVLQGLSKAGGQAYSISYNQAISTFMCARDGNFIFGIDLTMPSVRYGSNQAIFDTELQQCEIIDGQPFSPRGGAALLEIITGLTISRELLEDPLPTLPLRLAV